MIKLCDNFAVDAANIRITNDGYLVATPRVARTGIQLYYGSELGLTGKDANKVIRVNRPESEVFSTDSMRTYAHKPVTDDHPSQPVTADNWSKYGKGQLGDDVARDGEFVRVPLVMMDGGLIKKYQEGKAEISMGYSCDIEWTPGTTTDGQPFDASQKNIGINHLAIVDAARGGSKLRVGDGSGDAKVSFDTYASALESIRNKHISQDSSLADAGHLAIDSKGAKLYPILKDGAVSLSSLRASKTDAIAKGHGDALAALDTLLSRAEDTTSTKPAISDSGTQKDAKMKTMVIDGITVQVGDGNDGEIIQRHLMKLDSKNKELKDKVAELTGSHTAVIATKDGEIAKLTTDLTAATVKVTTLEAALKDAELSPAKLDKLVADRGVMLGKAKAILGDKLVVDGKTDGEIRRQVVDFKLADKAKGWSDDQISISFDTLVAGIDLSKQPTTDANLAAHRPGYMALASTIADGGGAGDQAKQRDAALEARNSRIADAWKAPAAKA